MEPNDPYWATWTAATMASVGGLPNRGPLATNQDSWVTEQLDPRSPRLNMVAGTNLMLGLSEDYDPVGTDGPCGPHFPFEGVPSGAGYKSNRWTNFVNNVSSSPTYYTDRDTVQRPGDAAGWSGADPMLTNATIQRPVMLNRPFRSVGEIGYTFRDDPWKSLNLFTTNSADAGLLDLFTIGAGTTNLPPSLIAGKININSAPAPVLQALIAGAGRDTAGATPISTTDAQTLSTNVAAYLTNSGPLINIAQLPGAFPQGTTTSTVYPGIKTQREALIRAIADSSTTRTWNLMIDVIAQSGRFKPNAASFGDFVVDGEKRYWLHVAIDRFTGQIIDQQLEPVQER